MAKPLDVDALFEACERGDVEYLRKLKGQNLHVTSPFSRSWSYRYNKPTTLHVAAEKGHLPVVKYLTENPQCDVNCKDANNQTSLHYASKNGHLPVVQCLTKHTQCDVNCKDNSDWTPLHYASKNGHLPVVQCLTEHEQCDVNCKDNSGWTPLHYASNERNPNEDLIEILLKGHADPNAVTEDGLTPLDMSRSSAIIQLLLKYGAKPKYENWSEYLGSREHSAQNTVKAFVVGDPGAGKSSLTMALISKIKGGLSLLKKRIVKMSGVDEKTAGIVPHDICNELFGRVTLMDFAGHKEFYASHDSVLRSTLAGSQSALFLLVVDLVYEDEKFKSNILYWIGFIENQYTSDSLKPYIIVVGSHVDKVNASDAKKKRAVVRSMQDDGSFENFQLTSDLFVTMDCRYAESPSLKKLRSTFSEVCKSLRQSQHVSFTSHWYLVYLLDKFQECKAVRLGDLFAQSFDFSQDIQSIVKSCEQLSAHGNLSFIKCQQSLENSWIILDKPALLTRVSGTIFAPEGFKEHQQLATSTGVVPFSKLASEFSNLDPDLVAQFLCHLEFCHEVTDPDILAQLQQGGSVSPHSQKEHYFFFPGLVSLEMPQHIWEPSEEFNYHTGWLLKCTKPEHFFTSRFTQVLLLRLAFTFGLEPTRPTASTVPTLKRRCSVWKNGISWSDRSGVSVLFEVPDLKQVVVLLRCHSLHEMALVKIRSSIIQMVLSTKKDLCPKIVLEELFLQSNDANCYPLDEEALKPVSMSELSTVISEGRHYAVLDNREQVDIEKLLFFEPYSNLGGRILHELFDNDMPDYHDEIRDEFLYRIADKVIKKIDCFMKLFNTSITRLDNLVDMAPTGESHRFVRVFQIWRDAQEEGSRSDLQKTLDQFSVFAGRNPLECLF